MTTNPNPVDHGIMSPAEAARVEQWCEIMHDAYELAAVGAGWETNPASRKPWADVPEANKVTMRAAVRAVIAHADSELRNFPLRYVVGIDPVRLDEPVPFVIVDEPIGEAVRSFPLDEGDTGEPLLSGPAVAEQNPADWTITVTEGGETFPFIEAENGDITGLGHQDKAAFADAIYRFELECGADELTEEDRFGPDHIVHAWVTVDPDNDEILRPIDAGLGSSTPGAFAVTGLWGQR